MSRLLAILLLVLPACQITQAPRSPSPALLQPYLEQARYRHAHWGICVRDLASGETLLALDADKLLVPASNTKLFSVAAAFEAFGSKARFPTRLLRLGEIDAQGRLDGLLVLKPEGDLNLGGRDDGAGGIEATRSDHIYARANPRTELSAADPLRGLQRLAALAKAAGLRQVTEVAVDDRLFDFASSSGSGPRLVTPMVVNDNLIDFRIRPNKPGQAASIEARPRHRGLRIENRVTTDAGGKYGVQVRRPSPGFFVLQGTIPAGHPEQIEVHEVADPAQFARRLLIEALQAEGIQVRSSVAAPNPDKLLPERGAILDEVARIESAPFAAEARLILKVSHNLHASTLPLLLAAGQGQRSLAEGMRIQGALLQRLLGERVRQVSFGGAAGGDRADLCTARSTTDLLQAIAGRPYYRDFRDALPVLGVDGTLHNIAKHGPAVGSVQAKTGTYYVYNALLGQRLLTAKALGGYMRSRSGRELAFCLMVNNVHLHKGLKPDHIGEDLGQLATAIWQQY